MKAMCSPWIVSSVLLLAGAAFALGADQPPTSAPKGPQATGRAPSLDPYWNKQWDLLNNHVAWPRAGRW